MLHQAKLGARARKRGVSLIEGVLYLIFALAVVVGSLVFYSQAIMSRQINSTASMMTTVSSQLVYKLRQTSQTLTDSEFQNGSSPTGYAIKSGAVPDDMIGTVPSVGDTIMDPWGGIVTFYESRAELNGRDIPVLAARMNDIPAGACMRLGGKSASGDTMVGTNVFAVAVEDNHMSNVDWSWTRGDLEYVVGEGDETNFSQLAEACEDGRDLVIYYEVNGKPPVLPEVGGSGTTAPPFLPGDPFAGMFPPVTGPSGPSDPMMCFDAFENSIPCASSFP